METQVGRRPREPGVWGAVVFTITEGSREKGVMESQGGTVMGGSMEPGGQNEGGARSGAQSPGEQ